MDAHATCIVYFHIFAIYSSEETWLEFFFSKLCSIDKSIGDKHM